MTITSAIITFQDFDIIRTLGAGGFGTCYEASYQEVRVCIKSLNRTSKQKAAIQSFQAETRAELFLFDHPHIVKLLACSVLPTVLGDTTDVSSFAIMFEMVEGRSLQAVLDDVNVTVDLARMCRFGGELASALGYVHQHSIAHLDLKPANVMVTVDGCCKLVDFGCSQLIEEAPITPTRSCLTGTFAYRAPELLRGGSPSAACDIYALGICLWQFWSRRFPFSGMQQHAVIFRVVSAKLRPSFDMPEAAEEAHPLYRDLAERCWAANPSDRPSIVDILQQLNAIKDD